MHALSGAYVVDALDDDERRLFEQHLSGVPRLPGTRWPASVRQPPLMADDAATHPAPSLRDSVLSGIKNVRPLPPGDRRRGPSTSDRSNAVAHAPSPFRLGLVAAAAAILAVVGVGGVTASRGRTTLRPIASSASPPTGCWRADDAKQVSIDVRRRLQRHRGASP